MMRGYGLPRNDDVANPDKGDQITFGLKGVRRRSANSKQAARRVWAKTERQSSRAAIRKELK